MTQMNGNKTRIAVIGGGASGLMAATIAMKSGAFVTLFERGDKLGKKLLTTGNGRGNFTNLYMKPECFRSNTIENMDTYLEQFTLDDTLSFFQNQGMFYKDRQGYCYPYSGQASALLQVFKGNLESAKNVEIVLDAKVSSILDLENGQVELLSKKKSYVFDKVIVACGSQAAKKTGSDGTGYYLLERLGYQMEPVVPALVQLHCKEAFMHKVAGVRVDGSVRFVEHGSVIAESSGEIQLTDYGISGIPVFQISRYVAYALMEDRSPKIEVDFFVEFTQQDLLSKILHQAKALRTRKVGDFCSGFMHQKLALLILELTNIDAEYLVCDISMKQWEVWCALCKKFTLEITQTNGFDAAQVCAGGLSMQEIDEHMRVKKMPNIYVVGELLDVDGMCGGYNLQWAWTSGYIAGKHAASVDNS